MSSEKVPNFVSKVWIWFLYNGEKKCCHPNIVRDFFQGSCRRCWCAWVVNSWVGVWPLPADFPFVSQIVTGPLPVFQCIRVQLCRVVCVPVCVWSPSLPYHPWPLQRVITRSSTTDSEVSTPDSSNNADPPSSHPPLLPLLWRLYIDVNHNYIFVQDILLFLSGVAGKRSRGPSPGKLWQLSI